MSNKSKLENPKPAQSYQALMLSDVDYTKLENNAAFSLINLESGTVDTCIELFTALKQVIREENLSLTPESIVAHLCAYLASVTTVSTVHMAAKLEAAVLVLINQQAQSACQYFAQYPINNSVSDDVKEDNLVKLDQITPSTILMQTMRLSSQVAGILKEVAYTKPKEQRLLCSQDTLTKIIIYLGGNRCAQWRKQLNGLSDNYVINQLAIQIGWLIGYFVHLSNQQLEKSNYYTCVISTVHSYQEHIFKLLKDYAEMTFAQEDKKAEEANSLLSEVHQLSRKAPQTSPISDFQKQVVIAHAGIEKTLLGLLADGCAIRTMLMSVFYFWFTLAEPLYRGNPQPTGANPLKYMEPIIHLVKKTVKPLPMPKFTLEVKALNEKMQALKQYIPNQNDLANLSHAEITQQTTQINTAIHTVTGDCLKQNMHPEAVANALFYQWLRLSVFFGITEQDWQKMDYYINDILKAVKQYIATNH